MEELEFQEHLNKLKIKVENGETRCMIEKRGRDISGKWIYLCYPCAAMCSGESILQIHISGKKHKQKLQMYTVWPITIFEQHPYILKEKGTKEGVTTTKQVLQKMAAEVDLHSSDMSELDARFGKYRSAACDVQHRLKNTKAPLLGIEYLIEHPPERAHGPPTYQCLLCPKNVQASAVIKHMTNFWHRNSYVIRHFPKAGALLSPYRKLEEYREGVNVIMNRLAHRIEEKYGRMKPVKIEKSEFGKERDLISQWISRGFHFSEKPGVTFEEVVDINLIRSLKKSYEISEKKPSFNSSDKKPPSYEYKMKLAEDKIKAAKEFAHKTLAYHEKNPEKHPLYREEWEKFWVRRCKEVLAEGKDASKHDFKPEWIEFWAARRKELHDEELRVNIQEVYRKLCLTPPAERERERPSSSASSSAERKMPGKRHSGRERRSASSSAERKLPGKLHGGRERRSASSSAERKLPGKLYGGRERRSASSSAERKLPGKLYGGRERRSASSSAERKLPGKRHGGRERRSASSSAERKLPGKRHGGRERRSASSSAERKLPGKRHGGRERRSASSSAERKLPGKRHGGRERRSASSSAERKLPGKRHGGRERRSASSSAERKLPGKRHGGRERRSASSSAERKLPGKRHGGRERRSASSSAERKLPGKRHGGRERRSASSSAERKLPGKRHGGRERRSASSSAERKLPRKRHGGRKRERESERRRSPERRREPDRRRSPSVRRSPKRRRTLEPRRRRDNKRRDVRTPDYRRSPSRGRSQEKRHSPPRKIRRHSRRFISSLSSSNSDKDSDSESSSPRVVRSHSSGSRPRDLVLKTEPAESVVVKTEPVESVVVKTEPAESVVATTEPAESVVVKTEPAESVVATTEPAESVVVKTEPAESVVATTEPAESVVVKTEPAESVVVKTEPAECVVATTEPAESVVVKTEPAECVVATTEPAESVVATLRLLVALEEYLGSLGPKVVELLTEALRMEKEKAKSSEVLLDRESATLLIETTKEKLKVAVQAGLVPGNAADAARAAIVCAANTLHQADVLSKRKSRVMSSGGEVDRAQIAQEMAAALIAQGKTDVSSEELAQLVDAVVESKNRKRPGERAAREGFTPSPPPPARPAPPAPVATTAVSGAAAAQQTSQINNSNRAAATATSQQDVKKEDIKQEEDYTMDEMLLAVIEESLADGLVTPLIAM